MTASAGAWYRVGTVNVTKNNAAVTGVGSSWQNDVIAIAIGDAFTIDAKTWYEVIAVDSDTSITLDRGFEGATASGTNYAILRNTSGTILTRIAGQIAVQFNQKQLFLDELRNWLNSDEESTTLTDSHGVSHSVSTISKMESLINDAVAESKEATDSARDIANNLRPVEPPALSAPFNESARLDYGYGKEYVAGLPVYGVDFTRSSECYFINKSGQIDKAGIDQPAIGPNGIYLHDSFTGILKWSTDFTKDEWNKSNVELTPSDQCPPSSLGTDIFQCVHVANTAEDIAHRISQAYTSVAGEWVTHVVIAKPDVGFENFRFEISHNGRARSIMFNLNTGELDGKERDPEIYGTIPLGDGWFVMYMSFIADYDVSAPAYVYFLPTGTTSNKFTGDGVGGGILAYVQNFTGLVNPRLLSITQGSLSTTAATMATLPTSRNLPAPGKSFTVVVDALLEFGNNQANHLYTIRSQTADESYLGIEKTIGDTLRLQISLGSWIGLSIDLVEKSRFAVVVDVSDGDTTLYIYQNGVFKSKAERPNEIFDFGTDGSVLFGMNRGFGGELNSQLKNFKILNYAASADEIQSWGSPK